MLKGSSPVCTASPAPDQGVAAGMAGLDLVPAPPPDHHPVGHETRGVEGNDDDLQAVGERLFMNRKIEDAGACRGCGCREQYQRQRDEKGRHEQKVQGSNHAEILQ